MKIIILMLGMIIVVIVVILIMIVIMTTGPRAANTPVPNAPRPRTGSLGRLPRKRRAKRRLCRTLRRGCGARALCSYGCSGDSLLSLLVSMSTHSWQNTTNMHPYGLKSWPARPRIISADATFVTPILRPRRRKSVGLSIGTG